MKILTPESTQSIVPHPDSDSSQPCHEGFAGLTASQRRLHAEILHRAYSIWEAMGRPENSELANWLEAEQEVLRER